MLEQRSAGWFPILGLLLVLMPTIVAFPPWDTESELGWRMLGGSTAPLSHVPGLAS